MATNPFGWNQVALKDTGLQSQAGIRTAQQATSNIMQAADDYQNEAAAIDANNFGVQGKLNNREIARRIAESGLSAAEFAQAQQSGGQFSKGNMADEFGINFKAQDAQAGIDDRQADLAFKEVEALAKLPQNVEQLESVGVGGMNAQKAKILAYANNPEQRKKIEDSFTAQMAVTMNKQGGEIINTALNMGGADLDGDGKPDGQGFGGLKKDGSTNTVNGREFVKTRATAQGYTTEQIKQLMARYDTEEQASRTLSPAQLQDHQAKSAAHTQDLNTALTHLQGKQNLIAGRYQKANADRQSVDMTGSDFTSQQIFEMAYKGKSTLKDSVELFKNINKLAANVVDENGKKIPMTPGRLQAVQTAILKSTTGELSDVTTDQIILALQANNSNYLTYEAEHGDVVNQYNGINNTIAALNKESATYAVGSMYNASKGLGKFKQKELDNYLASMTSNGIVQSDATKAYIAKQHAEIAGINAEEEASLNNPEPEQKAVSKVKSTVPDYVPVGNARLDQRGRAKVQAQRNAIVKQEKEAFESDVQTERAALLNTPEYAALKNQTKASYREALSGPTYTARKALQAKLNAEAEERAKANKK